MEHRPSSVLRPPSFVLRQSIIYPSPSYRPPNGSPSQVRQILSSCRMA